jgi:hypothetical protein
MVEVDEMKRMSPVQWVKLLARYRMCGLYTGVSLVSQDVFIPDC